MKERKTATGKRNVVHMQIDPSLEKYKGIVLSPEKMAKANEMLKNTKGLPTSIKPK